MRLKRQLKAAVPTLNLNDLAQARSELRRASTPQAPAPTGSAQAQIAAALAQEYAGQLAYETSRKAWMTYANGLWTPMDTEYIQQRIASYMDALLHGDYSWYELSGVEHLLGRRLAQTLTLETPGWLPFPQWGAPSGDHDAPRPQSRAPLYLATAPSLRPPGDVPQDPSLAA